MKYWKTAKNTVVAVLIVSAITFSLTGCSSNKDVVGKDEAVAVDLTKAKYQAKTLNELKVKIDSYRSHISAETFKNEFDLSDKKVYNKNFSFDGVASIEYNFVDSLTKEQDSLTYVYVISKVKYTMQGQTEQQENTVASVMIYKFKGDILVGFSNL